MQRTSHPSATRWRLVASLVATVVLLGATAARAVDFCIDSQEFGGNPEFRAFDFRLPKAGRCRSFAGHQFADADGGIGAHGQTAIFGSACTPSDGSRVN